MHALEDVTIDSFPFILKTMETYDRDCAACEHWYVIPDAAMQRRLIRKLAYEKGSVGPRGRYLTEEICDLICTCCGMPIRVNDRLEPHPLMLDHMELDACRVFPLRILFWRRSSESSTRHRNPLMDTGVGDIGVTIDLFSLDTLHTLYLGPWQRWCMTVMWTLIRSNVWNLAGASDTRHQTSVSRLRNEMFTYYAGLDRDTKRKTTQLEDSARGFNCQNVGNALQTQTRHESGRDEVLGAVLYRDAPKISCKGRCAWRCAAPCGGMPAAFRPHPRRAAARRVAARSPGPLHIVSVSVPTSCTRPGRRAVHRTGDVDPLSVEKIYIHIRNSSCSHNIILVYQEGLEFI